MDKMPIVQAGGDGFGDSSQEELLKQQLLDKITRANAVLKNQEDEIVDEISDIDYSSEDEDASSDKPADVGRKHCMDTYESLVDKTRDIPLEKVVFSAEGCSLFDDLCLRIDVNQRYASVLPQWKDVAHLLEVDALRTKWVETCVRPREGLTRAMLEMYMHDGGTLGDVLHALLHLECLDILESVRPKVESFLEERSRRSDDVDNSTNSGVNEMFFSVIKTLIAALGQGDPCIDLHKYANGLKPALKNQFDTTSSSYNKTLLVNSSCTSQVIKEGKNNIVSQPIEHQILVQNGSVNAPNYSASTGMADKANLYSSKLHLSHLKEIENKGGDSISLSDKPFKDCNSDKMRCRILLLFSEDGVEAASEAVAMAKSVEHEEVMADMFRLNEVSLWYEVLTNPEACCLKWCYEVDYIIPVLTPKFLHEIHGEGLENDDGLLPTSPVLNRYMYTLARTQYTQAGCKNMKVRPVIPPDVLREIRLSNAVKIDPLLNSSWVALNKERFLPRINGMLKEHLRRVNKTCQLDS